MAGERIGWDQVKQGYEMYGACPYYALFEANPSGRKTPGRLLFGYKGDDRDKEGIRLLEQNLKVVEQRDPEALLFLQFYDRLGKNDTLDAATPYSGSFPLRMREKTYTPTINGIAPADASFNSYLQQELLLKNEQIRELQEQVRDLEQEVDNMDQAPKKDIGGIVGQIGEAGNQFPWLAEIIKDWSTVIKHKFGHTGHRPPGSLAGVPGAETQEAPTDTSALPWNKRYEVARGVLMNWYARMYGDLETQEGREKGCQQFASDMEALSKISRDDDYMLLALKKLRNSAADM